MNEEHWKRETEPDKKKNQVEPLGHEIEYYDTCMPKEWNMMIQGILTQHNKHEYQPLKYKQAEETEISAPMIPTWYDEVKTNLRAQTVQIKILDRDLFEKMKQKYEPHSRSIGKRTHLNNKIPQLKKQWHEKYDEIMNGAPEVLPPFREINHEINLINDEKQYHYRMPSCPQSLQNQLRDKVNRYEQAKWWEPRKAQQAAPMMCILKKDGRLRTVIDARQRNDNTIKDMTPLPDQETIQEDVARAKYRSKIDLADAYKQIRVESKDILKAAFATIYRTYVSNIMQQGDCNAPATFQRLMTYIF